MPRKRRRLKVRYKRVPLDPRLRGYLEAGNLALATDCPGLVHVYRSIGSLMRGNRRDLWDENKEEILEDWIAAHPGTRPWGWWRFDAPEPRRCVRGMELLHHVRPDTMDWRR